MNHDGQVTLLEIFPPSGPQTTPELFGNFLRSGPRQKCLFGVANEHLDMLPGVRLSQLDSQSLCANNDDHGNKIPCPIFPEPNQVQSTQEQKDDNGDHNDQ